MSFEMTFEGANRWWLPGWNSKLLELQNWRLYDQWRWWWKAHVADCVKKSGEVLKEHWDWWGMRDMISLFTCRFQATNDLSEEPSVKTITISPVFFLKRQTISKCVCSLKSNNIFVSNICTPARVPVTPWDKGQFLNTQVYHNQTFAQILQHFFLKTAGNLMYKCYMTLLQNQVISPEAWCSCIL